MKVAHAEQHVLGSHGLTETKTFNIRTNAHAFKLLSSGLYSDKIAAVLREIGCNAQDAHVEAGIPNTPIVIKLPNRIDNQFYIRDYGLGLSHEDVMNLYTTYFASTKQNSNDFTGAFGLGSKSPFSYTDQFSVISVHGGVKRTYSAYLDNTGSPTISKLTESAPDADWPQGVQIGFPVKALDVPVFQPRAQTIYRWFRVIPKIEGAQPIVALDIKSEESDFLIVKDHSGQGVVMGSVFYPLGLDKLNIPQPNRYASTHPNLESFIGYFQGIVLKLKIGDVQVAASREELQYDDASAKVLRNRLKKVLHFIGEGLTTELRKAKTWDEKAKAFTNVDRWGVELYTDGWHSFFHNLGYSDARTLAGMLVNHSIDIPMCMGAKTDAKIVMAAFANKTRVDIIRAGKFFYKKTGQTAGKAQVSLKSKVGIYYGEQKLHIVRCQGAIERGEVQTALVFVPGDPGTLAEAKAEAEETAKELGISKVTNLDSVAPAQSYLTRVSKRKARRKKGAALPALPTNIGVCTYTDTMPNKTEFLHKLVPSDWSFMVHVHRDIRVFKDTEKTDKTLEMKQWACLWESTRALSKKLKGPLKGYFTTSASVVRTHDLLKRGYRVTYDVIKEWAESQAFQDGIVDLVKNWKPSTSLDYPYTDSWAYSFVLLRHKDKATYDKLAPHLKQHGLYDMVKQIHETSLVQGTQAGYGEPVVLQWYSRLAQEFNLKPIAVNKTGFLTIEDFDRHIQDKYPATKLVDLGKIIEHCPQKLEDLINVMIS